MEKMNSAGSLGLKVTELREIHANITYGIIMDREVRYMYIEVLKNNGKLRHYLTKDGVYFIYLIDKWGIKYEFRLF